MSYIIVGLGNPGSEYENTRHNTGRILVTWFGKSLDAEWKTDKKLNAQIAKVKIKVHRGETSVSLILPDTFMNKSGNFIKPLYPIGKTSVVKEAEKMVVIYDDLDLPFGTTKISFNKSSGGHKGLESIIKAVKTEKFARIRVGISPTTPSGKTRPLRVAKQVGRVKKPSGVRSRGATSQDLGSTFQSKANEKGDKVYSSRREEAVTKLILGKFKPEELLQLKKISKKINQALETFVTSGLQKAMMEFN